MYMLRFDVETIYKATVKSELAAITELRFDVETIYKATSSLTRLRTSALRFDVETIYKATPFVLSIFIVGCGLM